MGSRMGFEYHYCFSMDDEIISRYSWYVGGDAKFLFEMRTNFIVKRSDDGGADEIIDSERYETGVEEDCTECGLKVSISRRLTEYWMSDDEIEELVHKALAFAKQKAADPQHASCRIIPVAVDLDVCTVQQEGEPINATIDRAIRSEYLDPFYLKEPEYMDTELQNFLREELLWNTIRVENDGDLSFMEMCPICLRNPTIGAQISLLEYCRHAFHYHCIVRWLQNNKSCPMCRQQAHNFPTI